MDVLTLGYYLIIFYIVYRVVDYIYRLPKVGGLSNKYIFVTGCDTGFGHEIAKRLDKYGCNVFAGCLTEKGETELKKVCSQRLKTVPLNVAQSESVRKAYEQVKKQIPGDTGLWGLINNAGIVGLIGPVEWLQIKDYNQVFGVNLLGLIDTTVTFLPLLKKARGRIVNTASVFGRVSLVGSTPYCISKYGVEAFSDAIRRQLNDFGVTTHLIEPGFHKTNITSTEGLNRFLRQAWEQAPPEIKEEYGEEFLEGSINEIIQNFVSGIVSERISDVVDAYEHALLAMFPRTRYLVGMDARYAWIPIQSLPEWIGDWLLDKLAKDKPIPKAVKDRRKK